MSLQDAINFARSLSDIRKNYEQWLPKLENATALSRGLEEGAFVGKGRELALEAHVRAFVIDEMLRSLGWSVVTDGNLAIEDPVEDVANENARRRFLDYHGRDCESGQSFLVIEAKRPKLVLPDSENSRMLAELFAEHIAPSEDEANSTSPQPKLRGEWQKIVNDLCDYVGRVKQERGYPPTRAAITNGEWLVIFGDVSSTLLSNKPDAEQILCFSSFDEIVAASKQIYSMLNYAALSLEIPPQPPAAISEFIPQGHTAKCAQALNVHYIRVGDDQPGLAFKVCAWVRTPQNSWILFTQNHSPGFLQLDQEVNPAQAGPVATLRERADALIAALNIHRRMELISASEFETLVGKVSLPGMAKDDLVRPLVGKVKGLPDRFRITVGDQSFYAIPNHAFHACRFHRWDACNQEGSAAHDHPIMAPVIKPRSFFANGSPLHCAHDSVHTLRRDKCVLLDFEEFMCCKACTFHSRCWPDDSVLPCTAESH